MINNTPLTLEAENPAVVQVLGETPLSFNYCLIPIFKLVTQWRTVQFLEHPTEIFKLFKISVSEFGTMSMHRISHLLTEDVVRVLYKVVTQSCFGVTR